MAMVVGHLALARAGLGRPANTLASGVGSVALARTTRLGREPASARRRSIMYSYSGEPSAGR